MQEVRMNEDNDKASVGDLERRTAARRTATVGALCVCVLQCKMGGVRRSFEHALDSS